MKRLLFSALLATSTLVVGCTSNEPTTTPTPTATKKASAPPKPDPVIVNAKRCVERQDRNDALHVCSSVKMLELRKKDPDLATEVAAALQKARKADKEHAELGKWWYQTHKDDATGKDYKLAYVRSENTISLDFPYEGKQHADLNLRKHPRFGFSAFLNIREGQILCNTYSNTTVLVRADDGPAKSYECGSPASGSTESIFIRNFGALEAQIKNAKKVYVTVMIYKAGNRTFEFKVKGYDHTRL